MPETIDTRIAELADTRRGDLIGAVHNYLARCSEEEFLEFQRDVAERIERSLPQGALRSTC